VSEFLLCRSGLHKFRYKNCLNVKDFGLITLITNGSAIRLIVNEMVLVDILLEWFYEFKYNPPRDFLSGNSVRTSSKSMI